MTPYTLTEPLAVLLESSIFEKLQHKKRHLFHLQLSHLLEQIAFVTEKWETPDAR